MKKIFICFLFLTLCSSAGFSQKNPVRVWRGVSSAASAKPLKPLSNATIEALVARGQSRLVLQRALGVSAQRKDPIAFILEDGQLNRVLLKQAWRKSAVAKYRWDEGNMLGLNSWLIVLAHRIREGVKLSKTTLDVLEKELMFAQQDADAEYKKRYQYSSYPDGNYQKSPAFLSLLGESVAYRLDSFFLPMLSSGDRVRLLKVLMHGVFSGPVDWQELHIAVLYREVREALNTCGKQIDCVEYYGPMKKAMQDSAIRAAQEAAENAITSTVKLRELFIEELQGCAPKFAANKQAAEEWNLLIHFFQDKQKQIPLP